MNETAKFVRNNQVLQLQGRVNIKTVNGLFRTFRRELVPGIEDLDCSGIQECDSTVISLLLACLRMARKHNISLHIKGMNQQLLSLARLYDVETMLQTTVDS